MDSAPAKVAEGSGNNATHRTTRAEINNGDPAPLSNNEQYTVSPEDDEKVADNQTSITAVQEDRERLGQDESLEESQNQPKGVDQNIEETVLQYSQENNKVAKVNDSDGKKHGKQQQIMDDFRRESIYSKEIQSDEKLLHKSDKILSPQSPQSEKTLVAQSDKTLSPQPSKSLLSHYDKTPPLGSDKALSQQTDKVLLPQSDKTLLAQLDEKPTSHKTLLAQSDKTLSPHRTLSPQFDKTLLVQSDNTLSSPFGKTLSPQSDKTFSSQSGNILSSQLDKTLAPQSDKSLSSQSDNSLSHQSDKTLTPQSDQTPSPESTETISPQSDKTLSPQSQKTFSVQSDKSPSPQSQKTLPPKSVKTLSPQSRKTLSPKSDMILSPHLDKALSSQSEKTFLPHSDKKILSPQSDNSKSVQSNKTVSPQSDNSVSPQSDKTVSPQSDNSTSPQSDKIVSPQSDNNVSPQSDKTVSPQSEKTLSPQSGKTLSPQSDNSVSPQSDKTVSSQSDKSTSPQSDKIVSPQSDYSVSPQSDKTVSPQFDKTLSSQSDKTVSPQSDNSVSPQLDKRVSPQSDKIVSPQSDNSTSPKSDKTVSPQSDNSVSPQSDKTVSQQSDNSISPQSDQTVSTQSDKSLPLRSESTDPLSNQDPSTDAPSILAASEKIRSVITGQCSLDDLPPLPKKVVRIFVSSTFTDTKEERNALMRHVYPKLANYCRDQHGLEFQVVDMRWGIPEQASDNHSTTDLCIQEIKKCQEVSVGPNFVAIIGDKYGYRPVPSTIPADVFEILQKSKCQSNSNWNTVETWYRKDENAVPSLYILQPVSEMLPDYNNVENHELRKEAQSKWREIHRNMAQALRMAAEESYKSGKLTQTQKQIFFMSVTENEITNGVWRTETENQDSCFCIIRRIPDIASYLTEENSYRFTDITESYNLDSEAQSLLSKLRDQDLASRLPKSNLTQVEIEWSASGAAISLDTFRDVDVAKHASTMMSTESKTLLEKHQEYLDTICQQFFTNVSNLVQRGGLTQKKLYDEVTSDILQHWHLAKFRCDVFEGRASILKEVNLFLTSDLQLPLCVFGNSGCGKTSVMAKVMQNVSCGRWTSCKGKRVVLVARFLGTTPNTSNLHTLLVSICSQLSLINDISWKEPEQFAELVKDFHRLLKSFTPDKPLVLLLDSIDQLMPAYNAYKLDWLPNDVIPNVHIILSTIDNGYSILNTLRTKYENKQSRFVEVKPFGEKLGSEVISKWLSRDNRTIRSQQHEIIKLALEKCSLPLYTRIAYDRIRAWKSFDIPTIEQLETSVRGAINQLYESMEMKFGSSIVRHALAYLTASRYGLSEVEMEHILSLDDLLLNHVFKFWKPPIRRIAPLLWTRVRAEIHSYIVERSADDTLILYWYHRQFIEATKAKYLKDPSFSKHIHEHLTEYFLGVWGGGKEKPFTYSDDQVKRFKLSDGKSKADRKVPQQPFVFDTDNATNEERYNKRKLTELPYQLYKCKDHESLKRHVFFNYDWLFYKLKSTSVAQVIEEIELFMQADQLMKKDIDMKLLYVNMQLIRSYINQFPDSLSYELTGRLSKYIGKSDFLTALVKQCDERGCMLVPLSTCFESASLGMQKSIIFRSAESWQKGGCFTCCINLKLLYIIDYDDHGLPVLITYDLDSGEKINNVQITKMKDEKYQMTVDEYFQLEIGANSKYLLAFYKQKFIAGFNHTYRNDGLFDVINPDSGHVIKTYEGVLNRDEFFNPLQYSTENWVCIRFGSKLPLIDIQNDKRKENNRPQLLSSNEQFFITCGQKKTDLREFQTNAIIGEFDVSDPQIAVTATQDFSKVVMMSARDKQLKIFYLAKKELHANKRYGFFLKWKRFFNMEEKVAATINEITKTASVEDEKGQSVEEDKAHCCVSMTIGPDNWQLLVHFLGTSEYVTYLWNMGRRNDRRSFIGAVTPKLPLKGRCPVFNYDATCVIYVHGKKLRVLSTEDLAVVNEYDMSEDIKDFYVSKLSNKVLVMLSKSITVLDVIREVMNKSQKTKLKTNNEDKTKVLIPREESESVVHREIIIEPYQDSVDVGEVPELVLSGNTDRITSARSRKEYALEKHLTPNGLRTVHYHSKVQVIDTLHEEIKYSPKKGDRIQRVNVTGSASSIETIAIAGLDPTKHSISSFDLIQGDRIVNESGKIKFRVGAEPNGQIKLMTVPSVFSIYTVEDLKLNKLQQITVYRETLMTLSNAYLVTCRLKKDTYFANIYKQDTGKLIATHEVPFGTDCVRFSFDEKQVFIVDRSHCVRVYLAPHFNSLEQKVQNKQEEFTAFQVKDLLMSQSDRNVIVFSFGLESKLPTRTSTNYRHINLLTKRIGPILEISPFFEDISKDLSIAVDSKLQIYDLSSGEILFTIPYAGIEKHQELEEQRYDRLFLRKVRFRDPLASMQLRVRITDDRRFIVYIDKQDDTMHIGQLHKAHATHLYSCYTHTPEISPVRGLELRQNGAIAVLRNDDTCIPFLLKSRDYTARNISYLNEMSRAMTLVSPVLCARGYRSTDQSDDTRSVFYRRNVLLQQDAQK